MDTVEITVDGYFEVLVAVLQSIAFVFEGQVIPKITGALALVYFLILIFRNTIDKREPNPFGEIVLICFLGIMFVGGTSAKLEVRLTQVDNGAVQRFDVVQGVPFIVAFPYYVANRATDLLKQETKDNFLPVELGSFDEVDPLGAVSKLYNSVPPRTILLGGNGSTSGYDIERTIDNYFIDCVAVDHQLRGAPPTSSISNARKMPLDRNFFMNFRVDYDGISTTTYLVRGGNEFGTVQSCPDAYTNLLNEIQGTLALQWIAYNDDSGVRQESVAKGMQMIMGALTSGADAYDLQVGLFTAKLVRKGLIQSGFETDVDLMVHQAQQQRMFQKLGERSMFENITKPIITMFEALIFFLTPIYVILLALGSKGLAHMAKYFMLIIFVSLWSYVTIFIDVFTYYLMDATISPSAGFNPFSFDDMPVTMSEVESAIATAAAASQAVPFLLMFLMYGGVHSLMGAMKTMGDVKANGKQAAPDVAGPMNSGNRDMGNSTMSKSMNGGQTMIGLDSPRNENMPTLNFSSSSSTVNSLVASEAQSRVNNAQQAFETRADKQTGFAVGQTLQYKDSDGQTYSTNISQDDVNNLSTNLRSEFGVSEREANSLSATMAAGLSKGMSAAQISAMLRDQAVSEEAKNWANSEGVVESAGRIITGSESFSSNVASSTEEGREFAKRISENSSALKSSLVGVTEAETWQKNVSRGISASNETSQNGQLDFSPFLGSASFQGQRMFDAMKERDDGSENTDFTEFLTQRYGTTDFNDLRNQKGFADDSTLLSGTNVMGTGSDAGVMSRVYREYLNSGDTSDIKEYEAQTEAMRRGVDAMVPMVSEDAGNRLEMISGWLKDNESRYEQTLEMGKASDPVLNTDEKRAEQIQAVEAKVPSFNEAEKKQLASLGLGVDSEEVKTAVQNLQERGEVVSSQNVTAEAKRIKDEYEAGAAVDRGGLGAEALLNNPITRLFREQVQAFEYESAGAEVMDWVNRKNDTSINTAGGNGQNAQSIDPLMFESLNKTLGAFDDNGDLSGLTRSDLLKSSMALETIMAPDNRESLIAAGVSEETLDRYRNVERSLDAVINPSSKDTVFSTEGGYKIGSQDDYQAFNAVKQLVARGDMEASSGLLMFSKLTSGTAEASYMDKFALSERERDAFGVTEDRNTNGLGRVNLNRTDAEIKATENAYFDMQRNAGELQRMLNGVNVSSFDSVLGKMKENYDDTSGRGLEIDAAYKAANAAYPENAVTFGIVPGDDGDKQVTQGSANYKIDLMGNNSNYENMLSGFVDVTTNSGRLVDEQYEEGENDKLKLINQNIDELRAVANSYGGSVQSNTSETLSNLTFIGDFTTDREAVEQFGTTMNGYPQAVSLGKGVGNYSGELNYNGQDYGVYRTDDGAGTYYMRKGTVDSETGERKGWGYIGEADGPKVGVSWNDIKSSDGATWTSRSLQALNETKERIPSNPGVSASNDNYRQEIGNDDRLWLQGSAYQYVGDRNVDGESVGAVFKNMENEGQYAVYERDSETNYGVFNYYNYNPNEKGEQK